MISTGRIEGLIKYKEVIFDLFNNGYSVFIHDHRGQGLSTRLLTNPHKGHVDTFDHYVDDLQQFMQRYVLVHTQQEGYQKPHLLCHSMGGAIGTLYLLRHANHFNKVALSAPMFGIAAPIPEAFSRFIINTGVALNRLLRAESWYFLGLGDYGVEPFEKNVLTSSPMRYALFREEYNNTPEVQLGGPTFGWLQQAVIAMKHIEDSAKRVVNPCLILQAGDDTVVDNKRQNKVAQLMPHAELILIEGAKHELLLESDKLRLASMSAILKHFGCP